MDFMFNDKLNESVQMLLKDKSYSNYNSLSNCMEKSSDLDLNIEKLKIAFLRNFVIEPLVPVIRGEMFLAGFETDIWVGDYDNIFQNAIELESNLYTFKPNIIILAIWLEGMAPALMRAFTTIKQEADQEITRILDMVNMTINNIRNNTDAPVIINNFNLSPFAAMGILDAQSKDFQQSTIIGLNMSLLDMIKQYKDVYIIDYMSLISRIGFNQAIDIKNWNLYRVPFSKNAVIPFGQEYGKLIKAVKGAVKKCLILDCDNTLWGGILGEDGSDGIQIGSIYPGSCYQEFQEEILNLYNRGVILGICSKNNENDVYEILENHEGMILRRKHFAICKINWEDKVSSLVGIAQELNIGLDSIVFADDSEFECDLVRESLPQVSVICLNTSPMNFKTILAACGYFDSLYYTNEDKKKNSMYQNDVMRRELYKTSLSLEEYLTKLNMQAEIGKITETEIARIAQLTQKTNQFNLTTKRYTEGEIKTYLTNNDIEIIYLKLKDEISELGIVGMTIIKYNEEIAEIDTLLLSCRVIGRKVEDILLNQILIRARQRKCSELIGKYEATKKNMQVSSFYENHGFSLIKQNNEKSEWRFSTGNQELKIPDFIQVIVKN